MNGAGWGSCTIEVFAIINVETSQSAVVVLVLVNLRPVQNCNDI